jgi:hypothetical protein
MPNLNELGLILAPTFRSRAYVQYFVERGLVPGGALLLPGDESTWAGPAQVDVELPRRETPFTFRTGEPAKETAANAGWELSDLPNDDINSSDCAAFLKNVPQGVLIYSGLPKALIKQGTLDTGKKFLHAPGGYLPHYRGSTGFYFSLLDQGKIGTTVIWLNNGIDTGEIVARRWYEPKLNLDVDYVQDTVTRAHLLYEVIEQRLETGRYPSVDNEHHGPMHYIIHPLLKSFALQRTCS